MGKDSSSSRKREFILAFSVFVVMAVVGVSFGLWYALNYAPNVAPATLDSRR